MLQRTMILKTIFDVSKTFVVDCFWDSIMRTVLNLCQIQLAIKAHSYLLVQFWLVNIILFKNTPQQVCYSINTSNRHYCWQFVFFNRLKNQENLSFCLRCETNSMNILVSRNTFIIYISYLSSKYPFNSLLSVFLVWAYPRSDSKS